MMASRRAGAGGVDLDPDPVGGRYPVMVPPALSYCGCRLTSCADVLAVDAGVRQRIDDRLLAVVGLIHRRGDVAGGELDADIRGERVRDALDVARADDGDLARVVADPFGYGRRPKPQRRDPMRARDESAFWRVG